jgi:phosphate transport system permease protein
MSTSLPIASTRAQVEAALTHGRRDWAGVATAAILLGCLVVSLVVLLALLLDVSLRGLPVLTDRGADFLTSGNSQSPTVAGIGQALAGSLMLLVVVAVVAIPIGVGAAIYLEEYAHDSRTTRFIAANIRNLAGVPSIVYGILGLVIFVQALRKVISGMSPTGSLISGGLTLAALVLPIVIITTSEALRAVPASLREAAFGVGATKWETIRHHVLPNAAPGILTGTVLTLARAFGETAPLLLVGAVRGFFTAGASDLGHKLLDAYTALPIVIYDWTSRPQPAFQDLAAAAIVVMMLLLLVVNGTAIWLRNRYERRW